MNKTIKTDELSAIEISNRLELHRFHKALKDDELTFETIEQACCTMYKMGISPVTTIRKYLGKYNLKMKVLYLNADTVKLCDITNKIKEEAPTLIIYLKDASDGTITGVKLKYYPALRSVSQSKYKLINFTRITLK